MVKAKRLTLAAYCRADAARAQGKRDAGRARRRVLFTPHPGAGVFLGMCLGPRPIFMEGRIMEFKQIDEGVAELVHDLVKVMKDHGVTPAQSIGLLEITKATILDAILYDEGSDNGKSTEAE